MRSVLRRPSAALAPFVAFFGYFESDDGHQQRERVLPTGRMQLLVNVDADELRTYDGPGGEQVRRVPGAAVQGPSSRHSIIDTAQQQSIALVSFLPGGASPFLAAPSFETADQLVDVGALWGRRGDVLRQRLLEQPDPQAKLCALEAALGEAVVRPLTQDPAIGYAVTALNRGERVADVAERVGATHKEFIRRFREQVGLTPKRFARVRRFQRVLSSIPHDRPVDWAEIASRCGYADQSHLIRDFCAFTGISPTSYRARPVVSRNHVPLGSEEGSEENSSKTAGRTGPMLGP